MWKPTEKIIIKTCLENIKITWKTPRGIIKRLINRSQVQTYETKFKLADGHIINDKFAIAKHFNNFVTNIGPHLAEGVQRVDIDSLSYIGKPWKNTISVTCNWNWNQ